MSKPFLLYQLGTNNWQREGEYAPGSGILHEAHHNAYNAMEGVKCYSLYPSEKQSPHEDPLIRVHKLDHQIPVCESASPVSSLRWHTMSEEDFTKYRERLEESVYEQMEEAEEREGTSFDLAIAHHTFLNPVVLRNVLKRRAEEGKKKVPLVCFVHGTALKMYKHEIAGKNTKEYYSRFYPYLKNEKIFDSFGEDDFGVKVCYAISNQQIEALEAVFPTFPREKTVVSPNGVNLEIFHEVEGLEMKKHLGGMDAFYYEGSDYPPKKVDTSVINKLVVCVSKLADWKRIDVLLKAFKKVEAEIPDAGLVILGGGPVEAQKEYQDLAFQELKLERTYFLGPKPQPVLAEMYSVADVGCLCSYNEPFGMVFIECMACGTPVIAAESGGPKDFVSPEVGALVPENEDHNKLAEGFAEAIVAALKENWKAEKKEACKKLAIEKYSVNVQCSDLLKNTKDLLKL